MRTVLALALCFVVGACATFGGGEPDIYGIYDVVSMDGGSLPSAEISNAWGDLKPDGSWTMTLSLAGTSETMVEEGGSSIGEEVDGCLPFQSWNYLAPELMVYGTICDGVLTVPGTEEVASMVMHKRR
jgi:hypothetical protein